MQCLRQPMLWALCLTLSACGSAPSPLQPSAPAGGGGGGDLTVLPAEPEPAFNTEPEPEPSPTVAPSNDLATVASPTASPSTAPTPSPTPSASHHSSSGSGQPSTPAPTPTPSATATPTPSPSASAAVEARTLTVLGDRHLVRLHTSKSFGTSPFTIASITTEAYNDKAARVKFPALAGAYYGTFGWKYMRITPENAGQWAGDHGGPGPVCFLDSLGGEADNDGAWVVTERWNDGSQTHELVTEVSAKTDVTTFDPTKVAALNLGPTAATYALSAKWTDETKGPQYMFPSGCFLVYTRADGVRDFTTVGSFDGPQTIQAKGYVYAFFVNGDGGEKPDADLTVTLKKQ